MAPCPHAMRWLIGYMALPGHVLGLMRARVFRVQYYCKTRWLEPDCLKGERILYSSFFMQFQRTECM